MRSIPIDPTNPFRSLTYIFVISRFHRVWLSQHILFRDRSLFFQFVLPYDHHNELAPLPFLLSSFFHSLSSACVEIRLESDTSQPRSLSGLAFTGRTQQSGSIDQRLGPTAVCGKPLHASTTIGLVWGRALV